MSTRDRVLVEARRLAREGREVTAATVADALGLGKRTVASPLKRLRAAGLLPRNPTLGRKPRAAAPPPRPAVHVWPEGRPESWDDPATACLWYVREWRRNRKTA